MALTAVSLLSLSVSASAADYSFETDGTPEYYPSTSYEEVYGSQYNYGGKNLVDYQVPELPYGTMSTTQTRKTVRYLRVFPSKKAMLISP